MRETDSQKQRLNDAAIQPGHQSNEQTEIKPSLIPTSALRLTTAGVPDGRVPSLQADCKEISDLNVNRLLFLGPLLW